MSNSENRKPDLVCPRCRSLIEVLTNSPLECVWTIYSCTTCLYAWRSTEPEENTEPDNYPEPFRLKAKNLTKFAVVPTIPTKLKFTGMQNLFQKGLIMVGLVAS